MNQPTQRQIEAADMFAWAERHAARCSPLEIESDKPLLFWGAEHGRQRDADRAEMDSAMKALGKVETKGGSHGS